MGQIWSTCDWVFAASWYIRGPSNIQSYSRNKREIIHKANLLLSVYFTGYVSTRSSNTTRRWKPSTWWATRWYDRTRVRRYTSGSKPDTRCTPSGGEFLHTDIVEHPRIIYCTGASLIIICIRCKINRPVLEVHLHSIVVWSEGKDSYDLYRYIFWRLKDKLPSITSLVGDVFDTLG